MKDYKCKVEEIKLENINLKRLKYFNEYHKSFINIVLESIQNNYDEIDDKFPKKLIEVDSAEFDEHGYFTLGKDIWILLVDNKIVGFEVITRKRGGSIKLGPTYISPDFRGKGLAKKMIELLCREYKNNGARKVYVTAPLNNYSTSKLDYENLGFKLEAVLYKNYSNKNSERVCGKFLNTNLLCNKNSNPVRVNEGPLTIEKILKNNISKFSFDDIKMYIEENMCKYFDDIDVTFVKSLCRVVEKSDKLIYDEKNKDAYFSIDKNEISSLAIATPKRGGNYKVSPFIISDKYLNKNNVDLMVNSIEQGATNLNRKKISIFIPVCEVKISNYISNNGYICEGIIREPYKPGVDIIIFSKMVS